MKKNIIQQVNTRMDSEGNTELRETTIVRRVPQEPDFVKLYVDDVARLQGLTGKEREVLDEILSRMDYENKVSLATGTREDICLAVGIRKKGEDVASLNSFAVILNRLVKSKVIFKNGGGVYSVNPYFFGKGRWTDIEKIRLTISYQPGEAQRQVQGAIDRLSNALLGRTAPPSGPVEQSNSLSGQEQ